MFKSLFALLVLVSLKVSAHDGEFHFFRNMGDREIHVYLPPGYDQGNAAYPVIYMHDGQNLFDPIRSPFGNTWNASHTLNYLINRGLIRPVIVVAIDNTKKRIFEYTHDYDPKVGDGGGGRDYLNFIIMELMPEINKHIRVRKGKHNTSLIGSSLGGLISLYGASIHPDIFGLVAALSPSIWWNQESIIYQLKKCSALPSRLYLDSGDSGGERPQDVLKIAELVKHQFSKGTLKVHIQKGHDHSEKSWAIRFPAALMHLFPKTK